MTEESDLCVNEVAWELAKVVHLSWFFFLKGKALPCMIELDRIHKMILSIVIFLPANDPGNLTKSFSICMYIKMPF